LKNQFAQWTCHADVPDVITMALRTPCLYTMSGFVLALVLGMVVALMRLSGGPLPLGSPHLHRDLPRPPALLIFVFVGVAVPLAFPGTRSPAAPRQGALASAWSGRDMAETIRAGISGAQGQMEAARSLGFSHTRAMVSIIIPAGVPHRVPPLTNELVLLFKDSSLVLFLGVTLRSANSPSSGATWRPDRQLQPILVAGLLLSAGHDPARLRRAPPRDEAGRPPSGGSTPEIHNKGPAQVLGDNEVLRGIDLEIGSGESSASSARPLGQVNPAALCEPP